MNKVSTLLDEDYFIGAHVQDAKVKRSATGVNGARPWRATAARVRSACWKIPC